MTNVGAETIEMVRRCLVEECNLRGRSMLKVDKIIKRKTSHHSMSQLMFQSLVNITSRVVDVC